MKTAELGWRGHAAITAGITALTAIVFARAIGFDFVNYDDNLYVTGNRIVQRGLEAGTFVWAWTAFVGVQWYPLTLLSHLADVSLYGLNPAGHHATNVALHALTAGMLYLALTRLTGRAWRSACVALIFALHPLRAESVAWVAERKDVLSGLFWMLTLLAYAEYARRPGAVRYVLVLLAYACGVMSKPMVVTLPCVLLLLDWWPLGRIKGEGRAWLHSAGKRVVEKIPLIALAAGAGVLTIYTQSSGGAMSDLESNPVWHRLLVALGGYWMYVRQTFVPLGLGAFYPMPHGGVLWTRAALGAVAIAVVTIAAWGVRRRHPAVLVGWLWYLGVLVPVIGILQVGAQAFADRYTYLPQIGLLVAIVWVIADSFASASRRVWAGVTATVCAALIALTWNQLSSWRSSETLFARALAVTKDNARAHDYYGLALLKQGRAAEAIPMFEAAIRLEGGNAQQRFNLATAYDAVGDRQKAMALMHETLKAFPKDRSTLVWLGTDALMTGKPAEAAEFLGRAVHVSPSRSDIRVNFGIALGQLGRREEAEEQFTAAIQANPWYGPAYSNLGVLLVDKGDREGARRQFEKALELNPKDSGARDALAVLEKAPN